MSQIPNNKSPSRVIKRRTTTVVYFQRSPARSETPATTQRTTSKQISATPKRTSDDHVRRLLRLKFPHSIGAGVPLKIGISHELVALADELGLEPKQIKHALKYLTNTRHYIEQMCATGAVRVDLNGVEVAPVTEDEQAHANQKLLALIERRANK